jgi:hypothetical protein
MSEQSPQEIVSETTLQPTGISEPLQQTGLCSFFACCANSTTRKMGGGIASIFTGPDGTKKRILVIGKAAVGKTRILSLLSNPTSRIEEDHVYVMTEGTHSVEVSIPPMAYTFVEVGGSLSDFWARSMDNAIDGVWYIMSREELEGSNYDLLLKFLDSSRDSFSNKKKPKCLVVSVLDVESTVSTSDILIQVNALQIVEPHYVSTTIISSPSTRENILASLETLKLKLVT